jgi:predicted DsbA family dithiol-disulfide isomerase
VRIDRLREEYDIDAIWKAFPLHPETPEDGLTLEELYAAMGRQVDIKKSRARLKGVAEELGLPLGERERTYNSRLAQELAKWAESKGKGDEFHNAVFHAYFVLELRSFKKEVDSDWSRSYTMGITGVPTFVIGLQATVGFQPYEALEQFLKTCGAKRRDH